jgi:mycothiol synthase
MTSSGLGPEALRLLREEDAEAVAQVYRRAFGDARPIDADEIVSWCRNDELKPEWLRVLEVDGELVAYGDIWIDSDEVALEVAAPGHWDTLLEWAEQEAQSHGLGRARVYVPAGHEAEAVAQRRGYTLWRSSYDMEAGLPTVSQEPPAIPEGIELRPYRPQDEEALRDALNEVFADDPFFHNATPAHFRELYLHARGFDPSLWFLAWDDGSLAGFNLSFAESPGQDDTGHIRSLGVREAWRRRGLGEALLRSAFRDLRDRGLARVTLGVVADNSTGAVRLYERVGMRIKNQANNWVWPTSAAAADRAE